MEVFKWVLVMIASLSVFVGFGASVYMFFKMMWDDYKNKDWVGVALMPMGICCAICICSGAALFFMVALLNAFGGNYIILEILS